ncbi:MAG: hypothetical protein ACI8SE_001370 [Bacteroidia bacterium]|jgi:hypothetical protein
MKKILIISSVFVLGLFFTSCNDNTVVEPTIDTKDSTDNTPKNMEEDLPGIWDIVSISAAGDRYEAGFKAGTFTYASKDNSSFVEFFVGSAEWDWDYTEVETVNRSSGPEVFEEKIKFDNRMSWKRSGSDLLVDGAWLFDADWKLGELTLSYDIETVSGQGANEIKRIYTETWELVKR